jgi:outer membrane lipoprotein-sorting protein
MNRPKLLIALLVLAALGSTAIALNIVSKKRINALPVVRANVTSPPQVQDDGQRGFSDANRVRPSALSSDLRVLLAALGDRLEKPGKERVTYMGMLQRSGEDRAAPFTLIWETPGKIRLQDFGRQQTTVFDGQTVVRSDSSNTSFNDELLEMVVYDSAEHLFLSQMRGAATRFLGSRFRLSEAQADSEPVYDVYEVTEPNITRQESARQTRQYFFDSDTQVLTLVRYRTVKNGAENAVEVRFENFQRNLGQLFPMRIVRLENGTPVVTLTISSVTVGPRLDDGIFATSLATR